MRLGERAAVGKYLMELVHSFLPTTSLIKRSVPELLSFAFRASPEDKSIIGGRRRLISTEIDFSNLLLMD